MACCTSYMAL
uniref:Uncharacterized protein n=1 Tax=Rhizophora mucronata TaxID=61149 RepID=A0A2P2PWH9_RHIMU